MLLDGIEIFYDPLDIDAIAYYLSGAIMGSKHRLKLCIIVKCYTYVLCECCPTFLTRWPPKTLLLKPQAALANLKAMALLDELYNGSRTIHFKTFIKSLELDFCSYCYIINQIIDLSSVLHKLRA